MLLQQLFNGLALGAVYALVAVGYTIVYGIIELINFAHGEIYMFGAFLAMAGVTMGLPLPLAVLVSVGLTVCLGVLLEVIAYRPLRGSSRLAALISALGMSIFLQELARIIWGPEPRRLLPELGWLGQTFQFTAPVGGQVTFRIIEVVILVVAVSLMIGLHYFVSVTRLGMAMRCCAQEKTAARLMGINVNRTIMLTFAIGSMLGAIAGILAGLTFEKIEPMMGFIAGMKAFAAAVLGGIGNIQGAFLGGMLLGILEALGAGYVSSLWKDGIAFAVLIVILIARPQGLLGQQLPERA